MALNVTLPPLPRLLLYLYLKMPTIINISSRRGFTKGDYQATIEDGKITCVYIKPQTAKAAYLSQIKAMEAQQQTENKPQYDNDRTVVQFFPDVAENELVEHSIAELDSIMKYNGMLQKVNYLVVKNE